MGESQTSLRTNRGVASLIGEIGRRRGDLAENCVAQPVVDELIALHPDIVLGYEKTKHQSPKDNSGVDGYLIVKPPINAKLKPKKYPVQVKSSRLGVKEFYHDHPHMAENAIVIVYKLGDNPVSAAKDLWQKVVAYGRRFGEFPL